VAEIGPSVASDIYTIGRTLVVLCMEFRGYQGTYLHTLPPPESTPLFAANDSLYWLISKCCATDPADRFASADELRTQLLGVLREIVAKRTPDTALTSSSSVLFATPTTSASVLSWAQLPALHIDTTDPQHAWLASLGADNPAALLEELEQAPEASAEVLLTRARASLDSDQPDRARGYAAELLAEDPWEWRALWVDGLAAMAQEQWDTAMASFNAVCQQVPGELAPKLALAVACERGGRPEVAEGLYHTCAQTDAAYVAPASFGMARVRAMRGDTQGAVAALDQVPSSSRGFVESRQVRADVLLSTGNPQDLAVLDQAMRSIESVSMDPTTKRRYIVRILQRALDIVLSGGGATKAKVGSLEASEEGLRDGLEKTFRSLARDTSQLDERIELVNQANAVRSWTLT